MKSLLLAASVAVGTAAVAAPASALTVGKIPGAESGPRAETVAWYCNAKGHCIKAPRAGYAVRMGLEPACTVGWTWDGYRCIAPVVKIKPAPVVVVKPAPVVVIKKPKPAVVIKVK